MPTNSETAKLTLTVSGQVNDFLKEQAGEHQITVTEYLRRVIGVASMIGAVRDHAAEAGVTDLTVYLAYKDPDGNLQRAGAVSDLNI